MADKILFSEDELGFLRRHAISLSEIYDGRKVPAGQSKINAQRLGKSFILAGQCQKNANHRLKTRARHCIQCEPKYITFMKRETMPAWVYIALANKGRVFKVGLTGDLSQRAGSLCQQQYGGFFDWRMIIASNVKNAGEVERRLAKAIGIRPVTGYYEKDYSTQTAIEMYHMEEGYNLDFFHRKLMDLGLLEFRIFEENS
jgi:hypothetical protein